MDGRTKMCGFEANSPHTVHLRHLDRPVSYITVHFYMTGSPSSTPMLFYKHLFRGGLLWDPIVILKILLTKVTKPNKTNQTGPIGNKLFSIQPLFERRQKYQKFSIHLAIFAQVYSILIHNLSFQVTVGANFAEITIIVQKVVQDGGRMFCE